MSYKEKITEAMNMIGQQKWKVVITHESGPEVIKVEIRNIRTYGTEHYVQVEVCPLFINECYWLYYTWADPACLFDTKEEAEACKRGMLYGC